MQLTVTLGLLLVNEVEALGLDDAVDEGTRQTSTAGEAMSKAHGVTDAKGDSQDLLSLLVALGLAVALAVLLVGLSSLVGGSRSDELVRERLLVGGVLDLYYASAVSSGQR